MPKPIPPLYYTTPKFKKMLKDRTQSYLKIVAETQNDLRCIEIAERYPVVGTGRRMMNWRVHLSYRRVFGGELERRHRCSNGFGGESKEDLVEMIDQTVVIKFYIEMISEYDDHV
ncbi:hypothetical protein E6O75_ATG09445 [Venturia nashicola]|uniref:Uncharacterized protein n=1 Tax=Venturia nashicola TaxID=86259 RepID=A0A4Z1P249_9PEZI|nr:hypothetical protein E6O75_ATG09445 [Venturia nashicola]